MVCLKGTMPEQANVREGGVFPLDFFSGRTISLMCCRTDQWGFCRLYRLVEGGRGEGEVFRSIGWGREGRGRGSGGTRNLQEVPLYGGGISLCLV